MQSCPFYLLYFSPAIREVSSLYRWMSEGCLNPATLDILTRKSVEAYANGVNLGNNKRTEAEQRERANKAVADAAIAARQR